MAARVHAESPLPAAAKIQAGRYRKLSMPREHREEMGRRGEAKSPVTESALPEVQNSLVKVIPRLMNTALQAKMPQVQLAASRVLKVLDGRL